MHIHKNCSEYDVLPARLRFFGKMDILDRGWRCLSVLSESHGPLTEVLAAIKTLTAQCLFDAFGELQRPSAWLI